MPRPARDRAFGFQADGLVRILLAADVKEVKKALDKLGLGVSEEPVISIADLLKDLFDEIFGPVFAVRELTSAFLDLLLGPAGTLAPVSTRIERLIRQLQAQANRITSAIQTLDNLVGSKESGNHVDFVLSTLVLPQLRAAHRGILNVAAALDTAGADIEGVQDEARRFQQRLDKETAAQEDVQERFRERVREEERAPPPAGATTII